MAEVRTPGAFVASLIASATIIALFYLLATVLGRYGKLDIYMGMVYVFILSMIVTASIFPPLLKKRRGKR